MTALKGYINGNTIIAEDSLPNSYDGKEVIITILDKNFETEKMQEKKKALKELHSVFGSMTHKEAEDIRNHRVNFNERF